jgi:hypothetical protein
MPNPWDNDPIVSASAPTASNPWDADPIVKKAEGAKPREWSDVPLEAIKNIPSSAGNFVGGIYQAVRHPINTVSNIAQSAVGGLDNAARAVLPDSAKTWLDEQDRAKFGPQIDQLKEGYRGKADAIGGFFKDRYGSGNGFKKALATDPVGVLSDASAVLSGGSTLAGKVGVASAAGPLATAAKMTNPFTPVIAVGSKAAPIIGNALATAVGNMGTRTGAESIKQAFKSGKEGGSSMQSLADNMRGNVPMVDVLEAAKANLQEMARAKSEAYRNGMAQVSTDNTILNFNGIDDALKNAKQDVHFGDQVKNEKGAAVQRAIADEIENWKSLDPAKYHTPEGLDALKQKIGGIVDSIPYEEKVATRVGTQLYNAVKSEIVKQAPAYADTMKGYTEASEQIREIERALSLGNKASVDTAMRKLQSITRNNVNTNYGNRLDLARQLEQQGGRELMPALAGQALSSWTPRGMGGAVAGGLGMGGYAMGGPALAVPILSAQSPRLMGEAAMAAGRGTRFASDASAFSQNALARAGIPVSREFANYLEQAAQAKRAADNNKGNQ